MSNERELETELEAWDDLALDHESKLSDLDDLIEKLKTQSQRLKDAEHFPLHRCPRGTSEAPGPRGRPS